MIDGLTLRRVVKEIDRVTANQRLRQIFMVQQGLFYWVFSQSTILLSLLPGRVCLSLSPKESPSLETPPAFVMLLRKHLRNAKLIRVTQLQGDRMVCMEMEGRNEIGESNPLNVFFEIMGQNTNIILCTAEGVILDAYRRIINEKRSIIPGVAYVPDVHDAFAFDGPWEESIQEQAALWFTDHSSSRDALKQAIPRFFQGFGRIHVDEVLFRWQWRNPQKKELSTEDPLAGLLSVLGEMKQEYSTGDHLYLYLDQGIPKTVSPFGLLSVMNKGWDTEKKNPYEAVNRLFNAKEQTLPWQAHRQGLQRKLERHIRKAETLLENLNRDLIPARDHPTLQWKAQMIVANLYQLNPLSKQSSVEITDWQTGDIHAISLDRRLSISENAQKWFKQVAKWKRRIAFLDTKIRETDVWLFYLTQIQDSLNHVESSDELAEIEEELLTQKLIPPKKGTRKSSPKQKSRPIPHQPRIYDIDGFRIMVGRNNQQNDRLVRESAQKDLWFHTQQIPGSHVVIVHAGKRIPSSVIETAASLAAFYSKANQSTKIPVDYTLVQNVRKPKGAKPGLVIYKDYETIIVNPQLPRIEG